jgi:putative two-component system response regulator
MTISSEPTSIAPGRKGTGQTATTIDSAQALAELAATIKKKLACASRDDIPFFRSASEDLLSLPESTQREERVDCLLDIGQFFYLIGDTRQALQNTLATFELTKAQVAPLQLHRTLNCLGIFFMDTGNISRAIECYAEALEIAQNASEGFGELKVWQNLACALLYAFQYRVANSCFDYILERSGSIPGSLAIQATTLCNISWCALLTGNNERGLKAAETLQSMNITPKTSGEMLSKAIRESYHARILLELNRIPEARKHCEIAWKYAELADSARAQIVALLAYGLYEVYDGQAETGISHLHDAYRKAQVHLPASLVDVILSLAKAYERIGDPERAAAYLRESVERTSASQLDSAQKYFSLYFDDSGSTPASAPSFCPVAENLSARLEVQLDELNELRTRLGYFENLAVMSELRFDPTGKHIYRVGKFASLLATEAGCRPIHASIIELSARLHDIGYITITDTIVANGKLSASAKLDIVHLHTAGGAELLSMGGLPRLAMAENIARYHHAHWDGSGYPHGLTGTEIPLEARITTIASSFEEITQGRYEDEEGALRKMAALAGKQLDPDLTDAFIALIQRLWKKQGVLEEIVSEACASSSYLQAQEKIAASLHRGNQQH